MTIDLSCRLFVVIAVTDMNAVLSIKKRNTSFFNDCMDCGLPPHHRSIDSYSACFQVQSKRSSILWCLQHHWSLYIVEFINTMHLRALLQGFVRMRALAIVAWDSNSSEYCVSRRHSQCLRIRNDSRPLSFTYSGSRRYETRQIWFRELAALSLSAPTRIASC